METPASIMAPMRQNDWSKTHTFIFWSQKYLHFVIDSVSYQFWAIPFGLSTAPLVFTRVMLVLFSTWIPPGRDFKTAKIVYNV